MRMDAGWSRARFAESRVARLATADGAGRPHVVPIVFALSGDDLCTVVDAKPKSGAPLRRLDNMRANPSVSVLVDHYAEEWGELWWARADGTARILDLADPRAAGPLAALVERYPQYRDTPPPGPLVVVSVHRWSGWAAGGGGAAGGAGLTA
jgi:PPOX class probable F420-dependent enzyme